MSGIRNCAVIVAALLAAGCGSSDSGFAGDGGGGGGDGGGGGVTAPVEMGSGTGADFQPGAINIGSASLSAGGSTSLQVSLIQDGTLINSDVDVSFASVCAAQGLAQIESPINTTTGIAGTTYIASGCAGDDVITASAQVDGQNLSATGVVSVAPASVGSIEFVSATPSNIGLKGTGGAGRSETSTVVFRVLDSSGGPRVDTDVEFLLNSTVGGITRSPELATTDANGRVQTVVQAGTVATTVRVTARVTGISPPISTQSSQLTITTGLADDNSMSLAVECPNAEAFNQDGVAVEVSAHMADRFNNPVPDGTAITFTTEGGQIGGQCSTTNGACTTNWVSSNPRPDDGRSSILATAIGEESFSDNNGDGVFGDGDGDSGAFDDIPEPYLDANENGSREPGEPFFDFNTNGVYDPADGFYNGLLCEHSSLCSTVSDTTGIGEGSLIIMSGSEAVVYAELDDGTPISAIDLTGGSETVVFFVGDLRDQPMPAGTSIELELTNGSIVGPESFDQPCTASGGPIPYQFALDPDDTPSSGTAFLTVTTPNGLITTVSMPVQD